MVHYRGHGYLDLQLDTIDERVEAAVSQVTGPVPAEVTGVYAELFKADVTLWGDTLAVPVKLAGGARNCRPGDSVVVMRVGTSDLVAIADHTPRELEDVAYDGPSAAGTATTTSSSYSTISGLPSLAMYKRWGSLTGIHLTFHGQSFSTGAPNEAEFAIRLTSPSNVNTDHIITGSNHQVANCHFACGGVMLLNASDGVGEQGTWTAVIRVRRASGASTVTINSDDYFNLAMREVWL